MTKPAHHLPWSGLATTDPQAPIGVLGVPFDGATSFRQGAAQAPMRIRELTEHVAPITEDGQLLQHTRINDHGDVARDLNWERYFGSVTERAKATLQHDFALFLGGDHSVTIPLVKAFSEQITSNFGLLHIDAHTDLADRYEGHPWSHACTARRILEYPGMGPSNVVFCGIRSWIPEELDFIQATPGLTLHTARQIHQQGIPTVANAAIAQLKQFEQVYLTLDIDCLDPAYAPGTGTPEAGGLTTRELLELLRLIVEALPIRAMDVVEVSPPLDHSDITSVAAIKILYEVFGWLESKNASSDAL